MQFYDTPFFSLTCAFEIVNVVYTMNYHPPKERDVLLDYQGQRFEDLMVELVNCCQERTAYISHRFGIPEAEVRCLMLFGGERYLTPKGIAQKLDISKSRSTKIINGLLEKKLVESTNDVRDGRVKLVSLTPQGRRTSEKLNEINRDLHQKVLLELDAEQRKVALSYLEILRSGMEAVKKQLT